MVKRDDEVKATSTRKPYEKPNFTKLGPEQARLKLLGLATMGHQGAIDLLEMMFAKTPQKESINKKSA